MEYRETMWAELKPDIYSGENCDEVKNFWSTYASGDKESEESVEEIQMLAQFFPPGTKIVVSEPVCPECKENRHFNNSNMDSFVDVCDCGFNWKEWTEGEYA